MEIFKILSRIMSERGLTIAEVARLAELPDSTVRGIIKRQQKTTALDVAFKLSKGLSVSLEHLNGLPERTAVHEPSLSAAALKIASGYESLDDHGQRLLQLVLTEELSRIKATAE